MVSLNTSIEKRKGDIDKTYDWSPSLQGIILASFGYGYITTQIIGGRLAEYFKPVQQQNYGMWAEE